MAHDIDNSEVGQTLLNMIRQKQEFDKGESNYKLEALRNVIGRHYANGTNQQKLLDSPHFQGLSLTEKVKFIQEHKNILKENPRFNWGNVLEGGALSGVLAGGSVIGHHVMQHGRSIGSVSRYALGGGAVLGALVGGSLAYLNEKKDYNRDVQTQTRIDDAINALVDRSFRKAPTKTEYVAKITGPVENFPTAYGKKLVDAFAHYEAQQE